MTPLPPAQSPQPKTENGSNGVARDTPSGVFQLADGAMKNTKVQWAVIGSFLVVFGAFVQYVFNKADFVNSAMAQSSATTDSHARRLEQQEKRIEAVDAGTRQAIERLERKIDAAEERAQRQREEDRALMQTVLREVRKR